MAERRTRCSVWVAVGRSVTSSKAASGTSAITASRTPSSVPAWTATTPTTSAPHIASPDSSVAKPWPTPAVRALAPATWVSRASISEVRA